MPYSQAGEGKNVVKPHCLEGGVLALCQERKCLKSKRDVVCVLVNLKDRSSSQIYL